MEKSNQILCSEKKSKRFFVLPSKVLKAIEVKRSIDTSKKSFKINEMHEKKAKLKIFALRSILKKPQILIQSSREGGLLFGPLSKFSLLFFEQS